MTESRIRGAGSRSDSSVSPTRSPETEGALAEVFRCLGEPQQDPLRKRAQAGSRLDLGFVFETEHLLSRPEHEFTGQQYGPESESTATGWASDGLPGFEVGMG